MRSRTARLVAVTCVLAAIPASAVPAFARRYGTSCQTCHTVFPRLNGFGEAFRRNGYRFPGLDSDSVKLEQVPLGQEAQAKAFPSATWPGVLAGSPPLALGFNGQAVLHPDVSSGGGRADNGTAFSLRDLVGEAHLWGAGAFDDRITYFAEVTVSSTGAVDLENARVHFGDLFGPAHLVNLVVGKGPPTLTSFGEHSSYLADTLVLSAPLAGLYGATSPSFDLGNHTALLELNGTAAGRFSYALGLNAGTNLDLRPTENVTAHVGARVVGPRLDGEASPGPDPRLPVTLTLDVFGAHATTRFTSAASTPSFDTALVLGGAARVELGAWALDSGLYVEAHAHAQADNVDPNGAQAVVHYDELSWVAFPWLVPAVRLEYLRATPQGGAPTWDLRVVPGVVALIRPNLKASLVVQLETANGAPAAGWARAGGFATPSADRPVVAFELESVNFRLATAF